MKIIFIILICISLYGCATVPMPLAPTLTKVDIGMTKEQLFKWYGGPNLWSRNVINGNTYETWYYYNFSQTFDFMNNALTGYSNRSIYHSAEGDEDVRKYNKSSAQ